MMPHLDTAAVQQDNILGNGQSKTAAASLAGSCLVGAVKAFKNMAHILIADTDAGIADP